MQIYFEFHHVATIITKHCGKGNYSHKNSHKNPNKANTQFFHFQISRFMVKKIVYSIKQTKTKKNNAKKYYIKKAMKNHPQKHKQIHINTVLLIYTKNIRVS